MSFLVRCEFVLDDLVSLVQGQLGLKPWSSRHGWWKPVPRSQFDRVRRERDAFENALAFERELSERMAKALREIDGYSCYGTPWNAYIDVKRLAKAALGG